MIGIGLCVILTILNVALSDQIPPHCRGPPRGVEKARDCCKSEKIFTEEDFKACGIEKPSEDEKPQMPDCSKQICLLKRYNLMKDENKVDKEAVEAYLDGIVEKNAEYKPAVEAAKEHCLKDNLPGPPEICEATKIVFCISGTIFMNCPEWEDSDNCNKLKDHFNECKKYFI